MAESWRIEDGAADFFRNQQKRQAIDQRRPVPRKASDLGLGPGIAAGAVRVTNWNDELALFNGYFASAAGAFNAPNSIENFVGHTIMDSAFGGIQRITGMASSVDYKRTFTRNPADPTSVAFGPWTSNAPLAFPDTSWINVQYLGNWVDYDVRSVQYRRYNGELLMRGIMKNGSVPGNAFFLPTGFLPEARLPNDQHFPCISLDAPGGIGVNATSGVCRVLFGNTTWFDVSGVRFIVTH